MRKNTAEAVANEMAAQGYKPILAHATRDTGIKTWEVWGTDPDTLASVMVATREEWDQHVSDKAHANAVDYCAEHFTGAVSVLAVELADAIKRAEAAEAERELAGKTTDTYVENMGTAIRITVGSLTSLYAERRKSGGAKVYIQVGNSFMGLDLGEYAAAAFADWLQPRA